MYKIIFLFDSMCSRTGFETIRISIQYHKNENRLNSNTIHYKHSKYYLSGEAFNLWWYGLRPNVLY